MNIFLSYLFLKLFLKHMLNHLFAAMFVLSVYVREKINTKSTLLLGDTMLSFNNKRKKNVTKMHFNQY